MVTSLVLSLMMGLAPDEKACRESFDNGKTQALAQAMPRLSSHPILGKLLEGAHVVDSSQERQGEVHARFTLAIPKRSSWRSTALISFPMPLAGEWSGRTDVRLPTGFWCTELFAIERLGDLRFEFAVPEGATVRTVATRKGKTVLDRSVPVYRLGTVEFEKGPDLLAYAQPPAAPAQEPVWPPRGALLLPVQPTGKVDALASCGTVATLALNFPDVQLKDEQCQQLWRARAEEAAAEEEEEEEEGDDFLEPGADRGKVEACTPPHERQEQLCVSHTPVKDAPGVLQLNAYGTLPPGSTLRLSVGDQLVGMSLAAHSLSIPWDGCTGPAGSHPLRAEALDGQGRVLHSVRLPLQVKPSEVPPILKATPSDSGLMLQWMTCGGGSQDNLYWSQTAEVGEGSQKLEGARSPYLHKVPLDGSARFYRLASRRDGKTLWSDTVGVEPLARTCTRGGWCMDFPRRFSAFTIDSIWGSSPNRVWAVGPRGIFHWDGQRWEWTAVPKELSSVHGSGPSDVWAVGRAGESAFYWDGNLWSPVPVPTKRDLTGVWVASSTQAWAVGDHGTVLSWDGASWSQRPSPMSQKLEAVWGSSAADVWAVGAAGKSAHWDGESWRLVPTGTSQDLLSVGGSSRKDVWAVGGKGLILHWEGTRWSPVTSPTQADLLQVSVASANEAYVLAADGGVLTWDGRRWSIRHAGSIPKLAQRRQGSALWSAGADRVWALEMSMLRWDGSRWSQSPQALRPSLMKDLVALPDGTAWAVGGSASILFWNGTAWEDRSVRGWRTGELPASLSAVWAAGPRHVWAAGPGGYVLQGDGTSWRWVRFGQGGSKISDLWGSAADAVWAVGTDGGIYFWNGASWSLSTQMKDSLQAVSGSSIKNVWAVGQSGTAFHWDGTRWTPYPTGAAETLRAVSVNGKEVWVAPEKAGTLFQRMGTGWHRHDLPTTGVLQNVVVRGPKDVWAVSADGTVFHWNGTGWSQSLFLTQAWNAVLASAGQKLWLAADSGIYVHEAPK